MPSNSVQFFMKTFFLQCYWRILLISFVDEILLQAQIKDIVITMHLAKMADKFNIGHYGKNIQIIFFETAVPFQIKHGMYVFWMVLYKMNVFCADSNYDWEIRHNWENYQFFFSSEIKNIMESKAYRNSQWIVPYNVFIFCVDIKSNMATDHCRKYVYHWTYGKIIYIHSSLKPLYQLKVNFAQMFLGCSSTKWMFFFVLTGNPR